LRAVFFWPGGTSARMGVRDLKRCESSMEAMTNRHRMLSSTCALPMLVKTNRGN